LLEAPHDPNQNGDIDARADDDPPAIRRHDLALRQFNRSAAISHAGAPSQT
jgi:hypothetical protein